MAVLDKSHGVLRYFLRFLMTCRGGLVAVEVGNILWGVLEALSPFLLKFIIDALEQGPQAAGASSVLNLLALLVAMLALKHLITHGIDVLTKGYISPVAQRAMRQDLLFYAMGHSYDYYQKNLSGSVTDKINQLTKSFDSLYEAWAHWTVPVAWSFLFSVAVVAQTSLLCGALIGVWLIVAIVLSVTLSLQGVGYAERYAASLTDVIGATVNVLQNIFTVKVFSQQKHELVLMDRLQKKEVAAVQRLQWFLCKANTLLSLACILLLAGVSWALFSAWKVGRLTPGDVTFILATCFSMFNTVWWFSSHIAKMYKDYGIARQAFSIKATPHSIVDAMNAKPLHIQKGDIVFHDVSFHYKGHATIFSNLNVHIKAGEKVGLVGDSGGGKTTFVHLIMRFFDVSAGSITIDGQDIAQVTQDSLRTSIAFIPQDTLLFARTVKENLLYANPHASAEDLARAIDQTRAEEFIDQLPDKEHTVLGERGASISGGQRQRIAIARALLKNAPILILDEATSALDSITEHAISQSLYALMEGRTTIAIAHRLSTLQRMDRILVFVKGKIVEEGTHEELLAKKRGHYAKMWRMQSGDAIEAP